MYGKKLGSSNELALLDRSPTTSMRKAGYLAKGEKLCDRLNHPFMSWNANLK